MEILNRLEEGLAMAQEMFADADEWIAYGDELLLRAGAHA